MVDKQHRFSFRETKSNLPQPHLWYATEEVISALKLFLDAGEYLTKSATYRQVLFFLFNCPYRTSLSFLSFCHQVMRIGLVKNKIRRFILMHRLLFVL